jgi:hypothetical protein
VFHDREGFTTENGTKAFAIMEMPTETRPAGQAQARTGNSGALGNEYAMTG